MDMLLSRGPLYPIPNWDVQRHVTLLCNGCPRSAADKGCGPGVGRRCRTRSNRLMATNSSSPRPPTPGRSLNLLEWTGQLIPQGPIVTGVKTGWKTAWKIMMRELAPQSSSGAYVRPGYKFAGKIGSKQFPVESGRYHVYVGNACPWCHRVLLAIAVRGLEDNISFSYVFDNPEKASRGGWVFDDSHPDPVFGCSDLREVYDHCSPGFRGRCTAPLMVDKVAHKAVCNESSILMRNLNDIDFEGCNPVDLYPQALRPQIDELNDKIYNGANNAVYRSGFATSQSAYDATQKELYDTLDELDARLQSSRFLLGNRLTESDLRLFPTVVRFDAAYATLFKCSKKRIADYPNLQAWMRDVYQIDLAGRKLQIADTIDIDDARRSYSELFPLNPGGIVPSGPTLEDLRLREEAGRGPKEGIFHVKEQPVLSSS